MTVRGVGCVAVATPGQSASALTIHEIEDRKAAGDTRLVLGEARAAARAR